VPDRCGAGILAERDRSVFLVVDFQEKLVPHVADAQDILANLIRLCRAAEILRIPLLVTEQNPGGLGPTVAELEPHIRGVERIEKMTFSCFGEPRFLKRLEELNVDTLLIGGIEAHVCVAQTALHAILRGFQVHILVDAVGSRNPTVARIAVSRLKEAGAIVTCTEMALFELMGRAGTPEFKEILKLVKG